MASIGLSGPTDASWQDALSGERPLRCYCGSIIGMKLSVSLAEEDVEFLDAYAKAHGFASRSAVLQRAVRLLESAELGADYAGAWEEWRESGDADRWDAVTADGLASR